MEHSNTFVSLMTGTFLGRFVIMLVTISFLAAVMHAIFRSWKIQPKGFNWKSVRREVIFAAINMFFSGIVIGGEMALLTKYGFIKYNHQATAWWVIVLEFALYFVAFDTWFYWFHRLMHKGKTYTYVHKMHHLSTSPNLLTTLSLNPLESVVNGGFLPLFTAVFIVHDQSMPFIGAANILMGLYVHSGYEMLPRWWNKSWLTKWFITATFHDQHHKFFRWNFGGYTTVWDRICGTMRPQYEADFEKITTRTRKPLSAPADGTATAQLSES